MNIYQKAAATKLRFKTSNGAISTEDLFDLPLSSNNEMNLDTVAKTVYAALKAEEEGSFVKKTSNPRKEQLELAMEIVKDVIRIKQEEADAKADIAAKAAKREQLLRALERNQEQVLAGMTVDQLQEELKKLG